MNSFCFHNKDIFEFLRSSLFIERARKREFEAYDGFLSLFMWFTKMFTQIIQFTASRLIWKAGIKELFKAGIGLSALYCMYADSTRQAL